MSKVKVNENPNFFFEIGKSHTNQFIVEIIHDKYKVLLKDSEVKNLNGLVKFHCIKNEKYKHINIRVCCHNNSIYIDMGNGTIRKITGSKHDLIEKSSVKFLSSISTGAMTEPDIKNADIELLHKHININDSNFKVLLVAILNAFFTDTPHVLIALTGMAGSGKSTKHGLLMLLMDPSQNSLQDQFRHPQDLVIAAQHSHVIGMNNVSNLSDAMQNQMCTILSGGVSSTRQLYSNDDQVTNRLHNPMIINGIGNVIDREDLLERTILIPLKKISKHVRKTEKEVLVSFQDDWPAIMGGVCDTLSKVLLLKQDFETDEKLNRMADYHQLGIMVEEILGWEPGSFTKDYNKNIASAHGVVIDCSPLALALLVLEDYELFPFEGTYSELLNLLKLHTNFTNMHPRKLTEELDRVRSALLNQHNIKITKLPRSNRGSCLSIKVISE